MIRVLKPGLWSSIQDKGRLGYRAIGIPVSGVMDSNSANLANSLVENPLNAAVIEFTAMGPELYFEKNTTIAITGASFGILLNDQEMLLNTPIPIKSGSTLQFTPPKKGWRGYLAVKGGFEKQDVLRSKSMYAGITKNEKISKNDILLIQNSSETLNTNKKIFSPLNFDSNTIEAYKGPEYDLLDDQIKNNLAETKFNIHQNSNRMAIQLSGLGEVAIDSILTVPVQPGIVQITPSGMLLVLMRDAQTTGGYPRIFQLTKKSISCLAQKRPMELIYFNIID